MAVLRAEWTKQRTVAGPAWLLAGTVVATSAIGVAVAGAARCPAAGCGQDPGKISLAGVYLGQAVVAILGVLVIGNEYSTGMIRVTLTAIPHRLTMLAAKASVLSAPVLTAAALATAGSMLAGRLMLPGRGFTPAHGYPTLTGGADLRAAAGTMLYLTLVALLGLGIATAVRDSAVSIGVVLALLYLFPVVAGLISDRPLQRHLEQIAPMNAGLDIQATIGVRGLPLSPWQGLGVVALWTTGALLLGALALRLRDA
ncbi:MAG TPA: ABC transporter permease [Streptosporangiaceae bacterium]|nr:ABC transporter permease [Streptosporangiaceae bacterium]